MRPTSSRVPGRRWTVLVLGNGDRLVCSTARKPIPMLTDRPYYSELGSVETPHILIYAMKPVTSLLSQNTKQCSPEGHQTPREQESDAPARGLAWQRTQIHMKGNFRHEASVSELCRTVESSVEDGSIGSTKRYHVGAQCHQQQSGRGR